MERTIRFHCAPELAGKIPEPIPAKRDLPDWLKQLGAAIPDDTRTPMDRSERTVKACLPFLEAATQGYLIPFPDDVTILYVGDHPTLPWNIKIDGPGRAWIDGHHPNQYGGAPFEKNPVVKLKNPWIVSTPPGVSALFLPPQNRFGPAGLMPLPGLVDTDTYYNPVNIPAIMTPLRLGKPVTLKRGQPFVHVIPIPREAWKMEVGARDDAAWKEAVDKLEATSPTGYRDSFRVKKDYD